MAGKFGKTGTAGERFLHKIMGCKSNVTDGGVRGGQGPEGRQS